MKYKSTRGTDKDVSFRAAVIRGMGSDGGLLVPEYIPAFTSKECSILLHADYKETAFRVMRKFIDVNEIPDGDLRSLISDSYSSFRHADITPIRHLHKVQRPGNILVPSSGHGSPRAIHLDTKTRIKELNLTINDNAKAAAPIATPPDSTELFILELYHGPTFAFKDVALQFLGRLLDYLLLTDGCEFGKFLDNKECSTYKKYCTSGRIRVLTATSGDTGSAAISGMGACQQVDCVVLYPAGKVSKLQELQMTTVDKSNVHPLAIAGASFDDCQRICKSILSSPLKGSLNLVSANSINWARVMAQIVYFVYASFKLKSRYNNLTSFSVPTGNFGDMLAAYYAKRMGSPIEKLLIASNQNDVLPRFFDSGVFQPRRVHPSLSFSMDISLASNFERYIYYLHGEDCDKVNATFVNLSRHGRFSVGPDELAQAKADFVACAVDEVSTRRAINLAFHHASGRLLCPHTAIGYSAALRLLGGELGTEPQGTVVIVATAHIGKFVDAVAKDFNATNDCDETVMTALGKCTPPELDVLNFLPEKRKAVLPNEENLVKDYLINAFKEEKSCNLFGLTNWWILGGGVLLGTALIAFTLRRRQK